MNVQRVGIVDFCRSPIARAKGGSLNRLSSIEIGGQVIKKLMERNPNVPAERIEMLAAGCAFPEGENGFNVGRGLVIKAGLPETVSGITVNQFCSSSQQTTQIVHDSLALGKGDFAISVGLEHMTRVPMGGFNPHFDKELNELNYYIGMGDTAENLAAELNIPREEQDDFAINSHKKALKAWGENAFANEVVAIELKDGSKFERDEVPTEPNEEKIRSLKPAFKGDGSVTAANSSPVTVGVGAALLVREDVAKELGLKVRAWIVTTASAGCDYKRMGMGPIPASEKALKRANLSADDIDIIELNEAFAAQGLYVLKKTGWNMDKVNILGGAIALGHPLGMSGVRIIGTAITALEKTGGKYGMATMCVGGGQGMTTILERGEG
jgi:acetyl-CoA acyltransferase